MGTRKNTFNQIGYGSAGIQRMPTALRDAAAEHEKNRQRVVASILLELIFLSLTKIIKEKSLLRLSKAVSQSLKGSKEDSTQAAHCVPRQVRVGTETVQELMYRAFPERAWAVSVLFGETDILPGVFNVCDSLAEKKGLEEAFRQACLYAVDVEDEKGMVPHVIMTRAENAFSIYKNGASVAYRECIQHIKTKFKPTLFPQTVKELNQQLQIIEIYAETLRETPGKAGGISLSKIEGLIRVYNLR